MLRDTMALVFSGSNYISLDILSHKRAISAIPFGGKFRLIDFTLSNLSNADIRRVGVLTEFRPSSLIEHIYSGKPWDLIGRSREVRVLPPYSTQDNSNWYNGSADAVYQNIDFIESYSAKEVLLVAGENIYSIDFTDVFDFHYKKEADVTLVVKILDDPNLSRFGIVEIDNDFRITNFEEKPNNPKTNLVFLSMCIFKKDILIEEVNFDSKNPTSSHNINIDIIPDLIKKYNVCAYVHHGPWHYNGTIDEYWQNNMNVLSTNPLINPEKWGIRSNPDDRFARDRAPAYIKDGKINNSIVNRGCIVEGEVYNSILFPGVNIAKGSTVVDSIIMHDTIVKNNSIVEKSIIEKDVFIDENAKIGIGDNKKNTTYPEFFTSGITVINKKVTIPKNFTVGKNCLIYNNIDPDIIDKKHIDSGSTL